MTDNDNKKSLLRNKIQRIELQITNYQKKISDLQKQKTATANKLNTL